MGTIGSALSGYYQLSSLLSSGSGSSGSSAASSASVMQTLAQDLAAADSSGSGSGASSYLLDLSPQAQQLMSSGSVTGSSSASGSGSSFTLSAAQQAAIEKIIEKYKNSPFDQTTFDAMQSDLQAAGLSPQTLGAENQISSFDPTGVLLDSLSGNYASIQTPGASASAEQTKESNYMQSIVSLWKADSAAASSASGSAAGV